MKLPIANFLKLIFVKIYWILLKFFVKVIAKKK